MKNFSRLIVIFSLFFLGTATIKNRSSVLVYDDSFTNLFGDENIEVMENGNLVHLKLNEKSGSGFISHDLYLHGVFSTKMKLPSDYTAGLVVTFYTSNADMFEKNHDELDFEFLGNIRGKEWVVQTNIYGGGSTDRGREERYSLWFDPSQDFHEYSILWTDEHIIFLIDDVPIREFNKCKELGNDFPSKPMSVYATIWDGSAWATSGGKYKVNYKYAPFTVEYSNFVLDGCIVNPIELSTECYYENSKPVLSSQGLTKGQRKQMEEMRKSHMTYSYCNDFTRYPLPLPECRTTAKVYKNQNFQIQNDGPRRRKEQSSHHRRSRKIDNAQST